MKTLLASTAALALVAFASSAAAQVGAGSAVSGQASANAEIVQPLAFGANGTNLSFGTMVPNGSAATVTVDPTGGRSDPNNIVIASSLPATASVFNVTGGNGLAYTVTLPSAPVTIASGANSMTVSNFTTDDTTRNLSALGADSFSVGGTLNVGGTQAAGTYTGAFSVSVQYD